MSNAFTLPSRRRRWLATTAGLLASGVLAVAVVHAARAPSDAKPSVSLQLDPKPVNRGALEPASYSKVARQVAPSVVTVTVETRARNVRLNADEFYGSQDPLFRQFFGNQAPVQRQPAQQGLGSGVIVSKDGYIVTNNHVVESADKVHVTLDNGRNYKARVVGRDPQTDLAVIKIDADDLPAIAFADSAGVEVGDRVLAIGNPFGIGETVTTGIVSATGRRAGLGLAYENFIQTDAAINPGNSGGALVDIDGRLIGLNTAILSRSGGFQGVGLAVPSAMVRHVVDSLVEHGKVVRSYIGAGIQDVTPDLADSFGLKDNSGALVTDVQPGTPAAKAGLKSGDVVLKLDGKSVANASGLSFAVSELKPDTKVSLEVLRDGKTETLTAVTAVKPNRNARGDEDSQSLSDAGDDKGVLNGVAVGELDPAARRQLNIPARIKGALITDVDSDSASARAGLKPGDVILEINHQPVHSADDAVKLSEDASNKKTLLRLWSNGGTIYAVVDESDAGNS
jgi:serine protease Do